MPSRLRPPLAAVAALAASAALAAPASAAPDWTPEPGTTWQWQLDGRIDLSVKAEVYDVDLFDTPARTVDSLHAKGRHAVCYMSAGSWENWRTDADDFPASVRGRPLDGWSGERWLDVRRLDVLGPIMESRLDLCREKGFDAVEFDNVDGYRNDSGFALSGEDQLAFNRFLADAAHERDLAAALKNDLDQVEELEPDFDFAVNEQCHRYDECEALEPFVDAGKAVLHVEYGTSLDEFCPDARRMGLSSMKKKLSLGAWRRPCPPR